LDEAGEKINFLDQERFSAVGFSNYLPIASNDTSEGKVLNRSVDMVVVPKAN
jgi:outer membrane protein OmpA-like peptidoglycan-associated protein